jgi:hypothetical protein
MPFEVFDKRAIPTTDKPWVTIQKRGAFSLNRASHEALDGPKAVQLLYDAERQLIGFKATDPEGPIAYPVRRTSAKRQTRNSTWVISGAGFCKYYGIDASKARRFKATMENDILIVDLNSEAADATAYKARRYGTPYDEPS